MSPAGGAKSTNRRTSIREVAAAAGVAIGTVSKALSNDPEISSATRERVTAAANALGYRPSAAASGLKRGRSGNIGVVITAQSAPVFLNLFYSEVLGGIEESLEAADLHLLLTSLKRGDDLLHLAAERRADGLLVIGPCIPSAIVLQLSGLIPTVLVDHELDGVTGVTGDNEPGMARAAAHLFDSGRRRPGFICENSENVNFAARLRGFQRGFAERGLRRDAVNAISNVRIQDVPQAVRRLLDAGVDAIGASNDNFALTVREALLAMDVSFSRVAVVGYDGLRDPSGIAPSLTTMRVDRRRLGREGVRLLLERLADPSLGPDHLIIPTTLHIGRTTPEVTPNSSLHPYAGTLKKEVDHAPEPTEVGPEAHQ